MKSGNSKQSVSMSTAVSVLVVLAFLIGFIFLLVQQANFLVGRSLLIAFGNGADSTYKGAWFAMNGDLVAHDFSLRPDGPETDLTLHYKNIRVDTPGWKWVLGTLRSQKIIADTNRLHVTLDDGGSDAGVDPTLGDLGPFGSDTASPFEAEGCLKDSAWMRSELVDMGLSPGPSSLDFDYQVEGGKLTSTITLTTPGVSKVTFLRHETMPGEANPYLLDTIDTVTNDEHWLVEDAGFVKARNKYCAKRDGTSEGDFVFRHIEAVKRLMAIQGLALDEASWAAYAGFARNGGKLGYGGSYPDPLPSEIYYEARDSGMALTRMVGVFERDDRKIAAQWSRVAPRPLAGIENLATYAAMLKERGVEAPATTAPGGATLSASAAAVTVAPAIAPVATPATAPAAAPAPAVALAAARPGNARAPATIPALTAVTAKRGDELRWEELPKFVGHDIEIRTTHVEARVVTILEAKDKEIRVEGSVQGGHVENRINRDGFLRAVFVR